MRETILIDALEGALENLILGNPQAAHKIITKALTDWASAPKAGLTMEQALDEAFGETEMGDARRELTLKPYHAVLRAMEIYASQSPSSAPESGQKGMNVEIRHKDLRGVFEVDCQLYNRGDCLGIDFDKSQAQILLSGITASYAEQMIREIKAYINKGYVPAPESGGEEKNKTMGNLSFLNQDVIHKTLGKCRILGVRNESDSNNNTMWYVRTEGWERYWVYDYETEWPNDFVPSVQSSDVKNKQV